MSTKAGWAEPGFMMSAPRIQKAAGFNYFFCEKKEVLEQDAGPAWKALVPASCRSFRIHRLGTRSVWARWATHALRWPRSSRSAP